MSENMGKDVHIYKRDKYMHRYICIYIYIWKKERESEKWKGSRNNNRKLSEML